MSGNLALNYALGADIAAAGTSTWNTGAGFAPVGPATATPYTGTFDGLGHTVSGLAINSATDYLGLFGVVNAASAIRNVGLVGGSLTGNSIVGGLAGSNSGMISNSYASVSISGVSNIGGLVGSSFGTIGNSYATGSVSATTGNNVGGLVGYHNSGTISNSYATGSVSTTGNYVGGLVGRAGTGTIINSFYDLDAGTVNGAKPVAAYGIYSSQFSAWRNAGMVMDPVTYFGAETAANTYTVTGVQGMKDLLAFAGNPALTFNLAGNIDMSAAPAGFYIPSWAGTFDGAGKTISNFTLSSNISNIGLFGRALTGSTIKNVGLLNVNVTGTGTSGSNVGGLVGHNNYGTISNSYVTGAVSGSSQVGGLVGFNYGGTISNSYASATSVSGSGPYVGGLVGWWATLPARQAIQIHITIWTRPP